MKNHAIWRSLLPIVLPLGIGCLLMKHGTINDLINVTFLGLIFVVLAVVFALYSVVEFYFIDFQEDLPHYTLRTEPICVMCDGGPGNSKKSSCKCGLKLWDIDPAADLPPILEISSKKR